MSLSVLRILFSATWFVIGVALLAANEIDPNWVAQQRFNVNHAAIFAFLLGLWNLRRFFLVRSAPAESLTHREPRRDPERPFEYNPELDFTKQSGGTKQDEANKSES